MSLDFHEDRFLIDPAEICEHMRDIFHNVRYIPQNELNELVACATMFGDDHSGAFLKR